MSSLGNSLPINNNLSGESKKIKIICARWNSHITEHLLKEAVDTLKKFKVKDENIDVIYVSGSFELIYASAVSIKKKIYDAIIVIGCVIKGDTPHFDYICQGVTQEIARLNGLGEIPIIYGILTTNTEQQAIDRCNGNIGNKGSEFAQTALEMSQI